MKRIFDRNLGKFVDVTKPPPIKPLKGEPGLDGKDGRDGKDGESIAGLPGKDGRDGIDGPIGPKGDKGDTGLTGRSITSVAKPSDTQIEITYSDGIKQTLELPKAKDGREIELGVSQTHIQWRYVGDVNWINLALIPKPLMGRGGGANYLKDIQDIKIANLQTNQILKYNGTNWVNATDSTNSPGGSDGQIQYNNAGAFGGFTASGDLTFDTATGAGTLATVNADVGTFGTATQVATVTYNAKGLATAVSNTSIEITESQVTNLVTDLGNKQPLDADLTAIAALSTTGMMARTAANTYTMRTITGPAAGITISNGSGVSGNPTLALANDLSALEALASTGIACRTTTDTWAQRTIAVAPGGGFLSIANAGGVAGNPTITGTVKSPSANAVVYTDASQSLNGSVSSFTGTSGYGHEIIPSKDTDIGLAVRRHSSGYSVNLQEWQDETSSALASIDQNGNITGANLTGTNTGDQDISSGTYTPTLTNVANLDASTVYSCQYLSIGAIVTVSGRVDIDPTLPATSTQLGISLPFASNLANANECAGTAFASGIAGQGAAILGDAANNRAQLQLVSGDTTNQAMYFTFTYRII